MSSITDTKWQSVLKTHPTVFYDYTYKNIRMFGENSDVEDIIVVMQNTNLMLHHKKANVEERVKKSGAHSILFTEVDRTLYNHKPTVKSTARYSYYEQLRATDGKMDGGGGAAMLLDNERFEEMVGVKMVDRESKKKSCHRIGLHSSALI